MLTRDLETRQGTALSPGPHPRPEGPRAGPASAPRLAGLRLPASSRKGPRMEISNSRATALLTRTRHNRKGLGSLMLWPFLTLEESQQGSGAARCRPRLQAASSPGWH